VAACIGALIAVSLTGIVVQPAPKPRVPESLSKVGIFRTLRPLTAVDEAIPYEINVPAWSDGAQVRRWMIVPGDGSNPDPRRDRIIVKPGLPWAFPTGTVFVQHRDWRYAPGDLRPLETRVLVRDRDGGVYGLAYRWNADATDALLIEESRVESLKTADENGLRSLQPYEMLSPDQCLSCHNVAAAGGVLGISYRQINRSFEPSPGRSRNQLLAWNQRSLLSKSLDEGKALDTWNTMPIPAHVPLPFWNLSQLPVLTPSSASAAPLESRARSYLDANCSSCHAPGIVNADWDARITTPLAEQGLVYARPRVPRTNATYLIEPGKPEQSLLYQRVNTTDPSMRMPPVGRQTIDSEGARLVREWISGLTDNHSVQAPR
jgi:mono/diheme cytochrome c family protein